MYFCEYVVYNCVILIVIKYKKILENGKINIILYVVKMTSLHKVSKFKYHNRTN